jgi:hypothetical protein
VTEGWRRLRKEELHILYTSPNTIRVNKSRKMRWAGHVVCMEEMRNVYKILFGKSESKRPVGTINHRWEDNGS